MIGVEEDRKIDINSSSTFKTPSNNSLISKASSSHSKRFSKEEILAINRVMGKSILDEEEKEELDEWSKKHCINSKFFHINHLLTCEEEGISPTSSEDKALLIEYHNRDRAYSQFFKLWSALYFYERELNYLREIRSENMKLKSPEELSFSSSVKKTKRARFEETIN